MNSWQHRYVKNIFFESKMCDETERGERGQGGYGWETTVGHLLNQCMEVGNLEGSSNLLHPCRIHTCFCCMVLPAQHSHLLLLHSLPAQHLHLLLLHDFTLFKNLEAKFTETLSD